MRQLQFIEKGKLEWREAPDPMSRATGRRCPPGRPRHLRPRCRVRPWSGSGRQSFPLGDECVGEVTEVGDSVKSVKPGDLVSVPFQVSCGSCAACLGGDPATASRCPGSRCTACRSVRSPTAASRATPSTSPTPTPSRDDPCVLLVVSVLVFLLIRLTPGDPATVIAGDNATEQIHRIRETLGLERPPTQFALWFGNLVHGDLGESFVFQKVAALIAQRIEPTVALALSTLFAGTGGCSPRRARRVAFWRVVRPCVDGFLVDGVFGPRLRARLFVDLVLFAAARMAAGAGIPPARGRFLAFLRHLVLPALRWRSSTSH